MKGGLGSVVEWYRRVMVGADAVDALKIITRHNRLQGSSGLWDAVEELRVFLERRGVDARVYRVGPGERRGFVGAPVSWDPLEASLEIRVGGRRVAWLGLAGHPTLLSAHSPGGEGCGRVTLCRGDRCVGEAVLATGYLYDVYMHSDAELIIYYSRGRDHGSVPYTGLFLSPGDRERGVVMNIPYSLASMLIEKMTREPRARVEACWRARVERHGRGLPVLVACSGEPRVVFISHLCHPKPGAHDNASGSAANALLAVAAAARGLDTCSVWVPEYTGTVHLDRWLPGLPEAVINLDMIGSRQWITGSTLFLVNPPRLIVPRITPLLWLGLRAALDTNEAYTGVGGPRVRWGISPYGTGSDHDVFTVWGVEAPMLNEWPSRFYHTDRDTMDTISGDAVASVAIASAVAAELFLRGDKRVAERIGEAYNSLVKSYYAGEALRTGYPQDRLARWLVKKPLLAETPDKPLIESPLLSRTIYRALGRKRYMEIRRVKGALDALAVYLPLATVLGHQRPLEAYTAEKLLPWTRAEKRLVMQAWEDVRGALGI